MFNTILIVNVTKKGTRYIISPLLQNLNSVGCIKAPHSLFSGGPLDIFDCVDVSYNIQCSSHVT